MKQPADFPRFTSRRQFLATAGGALASTALPTGRALAQAPAKYHRLDLTEAKSMLDSYEKGITAMLKLPPSDPRNWYRNALVHTLDCPHGNWWLLPWHRGYIGWVEQTIRELSGDANFALPYWNWTKLPRVPEQFFGSGALNLDNPLYLTSLDEFKKQFSDPLSALWKSFSKEQLNQLSQRTTITNDPKNPPNGTMKVTFNSIDDVWSVIENDPMFADPKFKTVKADAGMDKPRQLTKDSPHFDDVTVGAVSQDTIDACLSPKVFVGDKTSTNPPGFGGSFATQHSTRGSSIDYGLLEGQPHNNVHNNVCGFMCDNLSPVDPLFFMHHANIDRLWDVWTRRQQAAGLPTMPTDPTQVANWKKEPFLFYIDPKGQVVTKNTCADYIEIGDFNYDYPSPPQPLALQATPKQFANKLWQGTLAAKLPKAAHIMHAEVMVPEKLAAASSKKSGTMLVARVTLKPGTETRGVTFKVLVNPVEKDGKLDVTQNVAGGFSVFGHNGADHDGEAITFTVPLSPALKKLAGAKNLDVGKSLNLHVVATRRGAEAQPVDLNVESISVGAL